MISAWLPARTSSHDRPDHSKLMPAGRTCSATSSMAAMRLTASSARRAACPSISAERKRLKWLMTGGALPCFRRTRLSSGTCCAACRSHVELADVAAAGRGTAPVGLHVHAVGAVHEVEVVDVLASRGRRCSASPICADRRRRCSWPSRDRCPRTAAGRRRVNVVNRPRSAAALRCASPMSCSVACAELVEAALLLFVEELEGEAARRCRAAGWAAAGTGSPAAPGMRHQLGRQPRRRCAGAAWPRPGARPRASGGEHGGPVGGRCRLKLKPATAKMFRTSGSSGAALLDLLGEPVVYVERGALGRPDLNDEVALVLVGDEARRHAPEDERGERQAGDERQPGTSAGAQSSRERPPIARAGARRAPG